MQDMARGLFPGHAEALADVANTMLADKNVVCTALVRVTPDAT